MKTVLEAYCKDKEAPKEWKFDGPGTATGEYGEVEWFLGSYDIENFSLKNGVARFEVHNTFSHTTSEDMAGSYKITYRSRHFTYKIRHSTRNYGQGEAVLVQYRRIYTKHSMVFSE